MGSLISSGAVPKQIGSAQDYINAFNPSGGGPSSDVGSLFSGSPSSAVGSLGSIGSLGSTLGLLPAAAGPIGLGISALSSGIPALISAFSGRNSTGPGSATADIASGAGAYSDPIIKLLGEGAAALPSGVPISSSSGAASGFGPYFDAARRAEDLVRWGLGGETDKKAQGLDAKTLQNSLTELGNPGKDGTGTLSGIQNAWNSFIGKNPEGSPGYNQLLQLASQMSPAEAAIFKSAFGGNNGSSGLPAAANAGLGGGSSTTSAIPAALGALPMLLAGAENINPMQPIRLPDQYNQGSKEQKQKKQQSQQLAMLLQMLGAQGGQS